DRGQDDRLRTGLADQGVPAVGFAAGDDADVADQTVEHTDPDREGPGDGAQPQHDNKQRSADRPPGDGSKHALILGAPAGAAERREEGTVGLTPESERNRRPPARTRRPAPRPGPGRAARVWSAGC